MCGLGRLYSKQNVIENLLNKEQMPESARHIKSLKDVKDLQMTPNPAYKNCDKTEGMLDVRGAPYICKLIGLEMAGKFRFVALWTCGCVFSERALKEIKSENCSLCQTSFTEEDVVILNGNEDDVDLMATKMVARTARQKAAKKEKKSKTQIESTVTSSVQETVKSVKPKHANAKSFLKRSAPIDALVDPAIKKLKDGVFSIAADKGKSEVYKSLFTSHKSEQDQSRAHWVTYNPFYN